MEDASFGSIELVMLTECGLSTDMMSVRVLLVFLIFSRSCLKFFAKLGNVCAKVHFLILGCNFCPNFYNLDCVIGSQCKTGCGLPKGDNNKLAFGSGFHVV
jgi:hypothetical protein